MLNKDRQVSVKGLAEREVAADKVTWPIVSKEQGNNLLELYDRIAVKQQKIKQFLIKSGIQPNEISINPPKVVDVKAEQYSSKRKRISLLCNAHHHGYFAQSRPGEKHYRPSR